MQELTRSLLRRSLGFQIMRMTKRYKHATDQRKRLALEQLARNNKKAEKDVASQPICHDIVTMKELRLNILVEPRGIEPLTS